MSRPDDPRSRRAWRLSALLYALLIAYGSLFPFSGWTRPPEPWAWLRWPPDVAHWSRADLLVNILAYVPLGFGLASGSSPRRSGMAAVLWAALAGFALSFSIESTQAYLPARVSSLGDLLTNTGGTLLGAMLARGLGSRGHAGRLLADWRARAIEPGRAADVALIALGLWALSQLSPLVPSFDIGNLRHGVAPIARTVTGAAPFDAAQAAQYLFTIAALALLLQGIVQPQRRRWRLVSGAFGAVLVLKVPMIGRQVSLEMLAGLGGGLALAAALSRLRRAAAGAAGIALLCAGIAAEALAPGGTQTYTAFNWVPFQAHLTNPLIGVTVILETAWGPFALIGLAYRGGWFRKTLPAAAVGAALIGGAQFALEYAQQWIPGRTGDLTAALIAAAAWLAAWRLMPAAPAPDPATARQPGQHRRKRGRRRWIETALGIGGLAAIAGTVGWAVRRPVPLGKGDKRLAPMLPAPGELMPARLPGFRSAHPRLPHPSAADLDALRRLNPGWLEEQRRAAREGAGNTWTVAVAELAAAGSQRLELLLQRLLDLKLDWRGHEQGKALAVAYDWLHDRWAPDQRAQLRNKLADAADYLIHYIREERLSPYNVYLYNAPFQALVACSLALWRDDPRGEPVMRFTADLWKNRVLPVWRQVMGQNGGWHEGGEYVGIGIGNAIWEVPAMWRSATGEDLFAAEPGIRGFLDFVIHRTRPDGTHLRIGDGAFFDRNVPARLPLAIEYRRPAAYSMAPPGIVAPTAWPWGPLPKPWLSDPAALAREPLSKWFDGIGWVIARSGWGPDATMVSFKAGDHYWSHSHLDQGSFTLYKGGALALDSGANYGPGYGSDHHLNYSMQTIAHNAITVTDPDDTVPMPAAPNEKPRAIANDGGQRRVGSGWGIEPAPLDLAEWQAKRELYHTGRIARYEDRDGITLAVADVTPAYTNKLSGKGTFSNRTRRVERAWRVFAYDRIDDVVVVYDDVVATRPAFRKRWLLHTTNQPQIDGSSFVAEVAPRPGPGRAGGRLEGRVLLPRDAVLLPVGGRGFEFWVEGVNYDEGGKLAQAAAKAPPQGIEPGRWRLEVMPAADAAADRFLVVLLPRAPGDAAPHRVRLLEEAGRTGAEVAGPQRTVRYWFREGELGAQVEVVPR